jgi:hypothetical protein
MVISSYPGKKQFIINKPSNIMNLTLMNGGVSPKKTPQGFNSGAAGWL